jgi:hypothetical protein
LAISNEDAIVALHRGAAINLQKEYDLIHCSVALLAKALEKISADVSLLKPAYTNTLTPIFVLINRAIGDCCSAIHLNEMGYFAQAGSLLRVVAETGMLLLVFAETPEEIEKWQSLKGKDLYNKFGQKELKKKLQANKGKECAFFGQYLALYSDFGSHPSPTMIISQHDGRQFRIGANPNVEIFSNSIRDQAQVLAHFILSCETLADVLLSKSFEDIIPFHVSEFKRLSGF